MQLSEIQDKFAASMFDPEKQDDIGSIFETGNVPLDERFKIYRQNIIGSLIDIIKTNFPLIEKLVGHGFLKRLTMDFINACPPKAGCLDEYGHNFAEFINTYEAAKSLPYLSDIAKFEWSLHASYYAQDDQALSIKELEGIASKDLSDLKIKLRASVHLIESIYPLLAIKEFCEKTNRDDAETLDLESNQSRLMIYRPFLKVEILELDPANFMMLSCLRDRLNLGDAFEKTLNEYTDFDIQAFLKTQIKLGSFLSFH